MAESRAHDVLILGTGLAGLRAALEIAERLGDDVDIGLVSKVQLMRAHSVCAEGGTGAVLRPEEGDNLDLQNGAGEGARLQERLLCLDVNPGELKWEHRVNLYMSDEDLFFLSFSALRLRRRI